MRPCRTPSSGAWSRCSSWEPWPAGNRRRRIGFASGGQRFPSDADGRRVEQKSDEKHRAADGLIPVQPVERGEHQRPVRFAATRQRQLLRAGILDIDRNVPAILSQPPERDRGTVAVALAPERYQEREGNE